MLRIITPPKSQGEKKGWDGTRNISFTYTGFSKRTDTLQRTTRGLEDALPVETQFFANGGRTIKPVFHQNGPGERKKKKVQEVGAAAVPLGPSVALAQLSISTSSSAAVTGLLSVSFRRPPPRPPRPPRPRPPPRLPPLPPAGTFPILKIRSRGR
jgi:hypothetical protein